MSGARTIGSELQDEVLKTVRRSQEAVVEAIQGWVAAVQSIGPSLPDLNVPFANKLPKPEELVAGAYDFAEQLLAAQRSFAERVLHATAPLLPGNRGTEANKTGGTAKSA